MSRLSRFLGRANSDEQSVAPGAESSATGATAAEDGPVDTKMFGLHDARLSGWFLVETNELYRGMPIAPDDVVVDVGCGEGGNLSFCAQLGASVIGIDLDEASIETARARIAETSARASEFHVAPAEHLPVADGAATDRKSVV